MVPRPVSPPPQGPLIPQFYAGKSVFITGATGFMGKVLIERLLWTCPEVACLHLLMREKKDVPPEKRLQQLKSSQVFSVIREHCPQQLDKLHIVAGDTTRPDLGIAPQHFPALRDVSIVFHSAATLKFDEALDVAVEQNVCSVISVMDLCDRLPNLQAFVHVSTAYSNAELAVVEERVYPAPAPAPAPSGTSPRAPAAPAPSLPRTLAFARAAPPDLLAPLTQQYIFPKPNTYTFTKALAETAIEEREDRNYPVAIFRPTIVVSSLRRPFPGWIENLNGPSGVVVGAGKGLLHVFRCSGAARADLLPVDIAIDTLIAVAWDTAITRPRDVVVYNCSTYENPTSWRQFELALRRQLRAHPLDNAFWYPCGASVSNKFAQRSLEFFLQTLPLHLAEYTARLFGIKTRISLITIDQRLRAMTQVLSFFSLREWHFKTDNVKKLKAKLTPQDAAIFNLDVHSINWDEHTENFAKGTRKYLLKEKDQDIEEARRHLRKLYYLHHGVMLFAAALACRAALGSALVRGAVRLLLRACAALAARVFRT